MFSYILFTGALFKNFYCRQFFAFEKLQKRSASSGDVRYFVKNIVLLDCGYGVATARQSESLGFSNRHRDLLVPSPNWSNSNTPTGPFHTTVPAFMMMSTITCVDWGPISKIISSSATSCADFSTPGVFSLPGRKGASLPTTTSVAIGMLAPRADIFSNNA